MLALNPILSIYTLSDEARWYSQVLVLIHDCCAIFLWPVAFTLSYALRAAGDVKFTTFISLFSMVLFRIIFSVILGIQMGMGAIGVWIAMVIDWVFRSAFHIWRF